MLSLPFFFGNQILALRSTKFTKLLEDEINDLKFGGTILKKGYPSPFNMETGFRVRPTKYGPADGTGQGAVLDHFRCCMVRLAEH